jgi:hypothetical protein
MANDLGEKTRCLEAYQTRCDELAQILWIQLKIREVGRSAQKQLLLTRFLLRWSRSLHQVGQYRSKGRRPRLPSSSLISLVFLCET